MCLADKYEESRLKRVVSVVRVTQHSATYSHDHPSVPAHKRVQALHILALNKATEQLGIQHFRMICPRLTCKSSIHYMNSNAPLLSRHNNAGSNSRASAILCEFAKSAIYGRQSTLFSLYKNQLIF
jgi:hypothetical protein